MPPPADPPVTCCTPPEGTARDTRRKARKKRNTRNHFLVQASHSCPPPIRQAASLELENGTQLSRLNGGGHNEVLQLCASSGMCGAYLVCTKLLQVKICTIQPNLIATTRGKVQPGKPEQAGMQCGCSVAQQLQRCFSASRLHSNDLQVAGKPASGWWHPCRSFHSLHDGVQESRFLKSHPQFQAAS